jgi:hypothetical protein
MDSDVDPLIRLVEVVRQGTDELLRAVRAEIETWGARPVPPAPAGSPAWRLGMTPLRGRWAEVERRGGETYRWPDGKVDEYADFVVYRGDGDFAGMRLALGHCANGEVVGFVLGEARKRGITYFFLADDHAQTREKVAMIRGDGPTGRGAFATGQAPPPCYAELKIGVLGERKGGKWHVLAVVAHEDDHESMLTHTAIQARVRGLA